MRIPVDTLFEKHELSSFDKTQVESWPSVEFPYEGGVAKVQVPTFDDEVISIKYVLGERELLTLVGELNQKHSGEYLGCMILARRLEDKTYRAVVFHVLFPLTKLGL